MRLGLPRGMRDLGPKDYGKILYIQDCFERVAERYGFSLMEPSTIELLETLILKSGPEIEKEIYAFTDKGARRVALRFDLTVGLTRYVVSNPQLPKPVKLASYSSMWRYDEPQFARYRNFYQWDVEVFGGNQAVAGGETMAFSEDFFRELGLERIQTKASSRKVMDRLLSKYLEGIDPLEAMRIIDKKEKQGLKVVGELLEEKGAKMQAIERILEIISISDTPSKAEERFREIDAEVVEDEGFRELLETMEVAGRVGARNLYIDLGIVRGIDYYDGVVFEVKSLDAPELGSLVGGGSFTSLVEALGGNFTAFGAAGGIERTILALEKVCLPTERGEKKGVFVASTTQEAKGIAWEVVKRLRRAGIPVDYDLAGRKLKGQLSYAEKAGFRYVVIVGMEEWGRGKVLLKDFSTREQEALPLEDLIPRLKG